MADNVGYTAGSGTQIASREITYSGDLAKMQVVGLATLSGADDAKVPTDISPTAPMPVAAYGELIEAIESMRMAVNALTKTIGYALPNAQGFPIMEVRQATGTNLSVTAVQPTASSLNATVSQPTAANLNVTASVAAAQTLSTVTTVGTLTNQSQIGGFAANDKIPALMHLQADNLRRNIGVS
jgi:hypothetical protein